MSELPVIQNLNPTVAGNLEHQWLQDKKGPSAYEIPDISERTTEIDLSYLRKPMSEADVDDLRVHIGNTYSWFIKQGSTIKLNGEPVAPIEFEPWAFPPGDAPRRMTYDVELTDIGMTGVEPV